jgi:L-lysine exporter family protein LysE/ArgO
MSVLPLFKGFVIGAGMIIPLGAQNSYILSQGIKRNFHFTAALICIICDLILMSIGIFGGGALINSSDTLFNIITWGGIVFLSFYGAIFFKNFLLSHKDSIAKVSPLSSRKAVIMTTLAVTLLNPHVYLDTVMIIGSISAQFAEQDKWVFLTGTVLASLTWFYSLSFSAAKFSPWLSKSQVQRGINLVVAIIMWGIAFSLLNSL